MRQRLVTRITQHLASIKLAKVDRFGSIAVGLGPRLRDFVDHPCGQLVFTLAHDRRHAKQQGCAIRGRRVLPGFKSFRGFFNSAIRELFCGFVESSDYLCAIRRIDTVEQVAGVDAFAADDEWILASELTLDFLNRIAHRRGVLFFSEIGKWFVTKFCRHDVSIERILATDYTDFYRDHPQTIRARSVASPTFQLFVIS